MSKYSKILKWLLLMFLLVLLFFNLSPIKYDYNNNIVVNYIGNIQDSILNKKEIETSVSSIRNSSDSLSKDINTTLLEDLIEEETYVKKAEVYLDVLGVLNVYIYMREPFVRMIKNGSINYLDVDGVVLPRLINPDQDLLIFKGENSPPFQDLVQLVSQIYNNETLNKLIGGIHYSDESGYLLSAKVCDLQISIGKSHIIESRKISMINIFYEFLFEYLDCDYCNEINIRYDNQIICVK